MKSVWLRVTAGAVVLLGAFLLALYFYIDSIARRVIERGSTYALGVDTDLGSTRIGLFSGAFGLRGIEVANPPGFEAPHFLGVREAQLDLDMGTLREPIVVVPLLALRGVEVDLDKRRGGANYEAILDNLARFESKDAEPAPPPEPGESPGKRFVVQDVVIRDMEAHVRVVQAGGLGKVNVIVPEVRMRNLGGEGRPLTAPQVTSIVVKAVLMSIAKAGAALPGGVASALFGGLARLSIISLELPEGGKVAGAVRTGAETAGDAASRARDAGKSAAGGAGRRLKDLGGRIRGNE